MFKSLVHSEIDLQSPQSHLTTKQKELLEDIKKDVCNNNDVIVDSGYTGPISEANISDIARTVAVNMLNKRMLYLKQFKEGLKLLGLLDILSIHPELCREFFVIGNSDVIDANYLLENIKPEYSPECSTRRQLEEQAMDYFQDLLFSMEDEQLTPLACAINWNDSKEEDEDICMTRTLAKQQLSRLWTPDITPAGVMGWITGRRHRNVFGGETKITVKCDHDCLVRNLMHTICFPVVSACAMQITFPLQHMKTSEEFKNVFFLGYNKGQAFARK